MSEGRKIRKVCGACGEDALYWDASAVWSEGVQNFVMSEDVGDFHSCGECGEENNSKNVCLQTGEEVKWAPQSGYVPVEQAEKLWDLHNYKLRKNQEEKADV